MMLKLQCLHPINCFKLFIVLILLFRESHPRIKYIAGLTGVSVVITNCCINFNFNMSIYDFHHWLLADRDLDLRFSRLNWKKKKKKDSHISGMGGPIDMGRKPGIERDMNRYDAGFSIWPWTSPMTLTSDFQGQVLKWLYLRKMLSDWHETTGIKIDTMLGPLFSCDQVALQMVFSVCPSVTPFWLCSHHRIIMKFSGVITNDQSKVHAKGQCQRSKVKVTEVTTQLNRFRTVTPVWIHIWWWNDAYSLIMVRRGALLFFKVIRQISRLHGSKNRRIWPRLGVSGLQLKFEFTNGYKMMHKAWSSIEEVPYCFARSSVIFQGRTALKIVEFDPDWAFPDCNLSLNSPMGTKWCTKLEVA